MQIYSTSDIYLAAAILSAIPTKLVGWDRTTPEKTFFHFFKNDVPEEFVESYKNRELRVDPLRYGMSKRYLEMVQEGFYL